jgi:hypothetical protein
VRAEGSDPKDFVELDLAGLVDSAADEVWPQAQARGIRIEVDTRDAERRRPSCGATSPCCAGR